MEDSSVQNRSLRTEAVETVGNYNTIAIPIRVFQQYNSPKSDESDIEVGG